jgi:magnesium chelatase family protein
MDLLVDVRRPTGAALLGPPAADSATVRARVGDARARQLARLKDGTATCNGHMDARQLREHVRLAEGAQQAVSRAYDAGVLSARGRHRVLRVARTIADLEGHERVLEGDVLLALSMRQRGADEPGVSA